MEELDFQGLLDRFNKDGFQRGERVILGHFGTVQTLLSLILDEPVTVRLRDQHETPSAISRCVDLMASDMAVCHAASVIPKALNHPDVYTNVLSGKLGLGQIVIKLGIANTRSLLTVGRDAVTFSRRYLISGGGGIAPGPKLHMEIEEVFPRSPFVIAGWLEKDWKEGKDVKPE